MSELVSTIGKLTEIKTFSSITTEPNWLQQIRAESWKDFLELPWESDPNMLNFVDKKLLQSLEANYPPNIASMNPTMTLNTQDDKNQFNFSPNEIGSSFSSDLEPLGEDQHPFTAELLTIESLEKSTFAKTIQSLLETKFNDKMASFTRATFDWGSFFQIKSKSVIQQPVTLYYGLSSANKLSLAGTHLIEIQDNVEVTLDIVYDTADHKFDYSNTIIRVGKNSHVKILISDAGQFDRKTVRAIHISIGKDASVNFAQLQTEGRYIRQRSEVHFIAEGGDLMEIACIRGYINQIYDFYSAVFHEAPNSTSRTVARAVMDDEALAFFKGLVDIKYEAPQTNTDLNLAGLLLSKKARFHSIPAMEVSNNNVIATHGASVSKIDPELLFYLQTRGIDIEEAEHMVSNGFFAPAIEKIDNSFLRNKAYGIIQKAVDQQYS